MNKEKILKNPFVVAALSLTAVAFIVVNNVLPLLPKKSDTPVESEEIVANPILNTILPEPVSNPDLIILDTIKKNSLQTIGWKRLGGRNPFVNEIRKNSLITKKQAAVGIDTNYQSVTNHNGLTLKKPLRPVKKLLQAISVGKTEKVVMIGTRMYHEGDTCSLGIIDLITADSVRIQGPNGVRILQF
jgi:hypothetical protein